MRPASFLFAAAALLPAAALEAAPRLSMHEPTYLHLATGHPDGKLRTQFSVKYKFLDIGSRPGPQGSGMYLAYTQRLLWDMWNASRSWPIDDVNYLPELFYRRDLPADLGMGVKGLEAGLLHHSNGGTKDPDPLDPDDEFTKNYFGTFLRIHQAWQGEQLRGRLETTLRSFNETFENPEIGRYMGFVVVKAQIDFRFLKNKEGKYVFDDNTFFFGSNESFFRKLPSRHPARDAERVFSADVGLALGMGWLARLLGLQGAGSIFFHYFNGFGEFLSTYNDNRENRFYVGFMLRPHRPWN